MTPQKKNANPLPASSKFFHQLFRPGVIGLLLTIITIAIYQPVRHHDFISLDDPVYVSENPRVSGGLTSENILWAFQTTEGGSWHPLTWLSLMLDGQFFGLKAGGYHIINVLLHVVSTLLLFAVLRLMTGTLWRSAVVAALFAWHPLHVESVAWVSERKDVLSTVFWLLTLWAYAKYSRLARNTGHGETVQSPRPTQQRWLYYGLALGCFLLGLMSKPMLVTLPFVMLLLDHWPLQRMTNIRVGNVWPLLREKLPFFTISAGASGLTLWAQRKSEAIASLDWAPMSARIANSLVSYSRYLGKTFWPVDLAIYYPHRWDWSAFVILSAAVLFVGLSCAAFRWKRSQPYFLTGWFWFAGTLVPVIGLVQVGSQSMADRYTYVPLIGVFIMLAWGIAALAGSASTIQKRAIVAVALLAAGTCAALTANQVRHWQDSEKLFRHALAVTRNNDLAHNILAAGLIERGQADEAIEHCRVALQLRPDAPDTLKNLGLAYASQGRYNEAISQYERALQIRPGDERTCNSLGLALASQGKLAAATEQFRLALQARPDALDVLNNLGLALALQGQTEAALKHYEHALKLKPDQEKVLNNIGLALAGSQRLDEALDYYRRALRVKPDYVDALVNSGVALTAKGQFDLAIESYRAALRLKPDNLEALNNLGMLLTRRGETDEAITHLRRAREMLPNHPQVLSNLGAALANKGLLAEAIACFEAALQSKPDYFDAHARLGQTLAKAGRKQDAVRHLSEALRLQPDNAEVMEQLRALGVP